QKQLLVPQHVVDRVDDGAQYLFHWMFPSFPKVCGPRAGRADAKRAGRAAALSSSCTKQKRTAGPFGPVPFTLSFYLRDSASPPCTFGPRNELLQSHIHL